MAIPANMVAAFDSRYASRSDPGRMEAFRTVLSDGIKRGRIPFWQLRRRYYKRENAEFAMLSIEYENYELAMEWAADAGADKELLVTQYMLIFGHAPLYTWD